MVNSLSVVILAYNEEANVAKSISEISTVLKNSPLKDYEIILVNDGSKDRTGEIAHSLVKKIPKLRVVDNNPNRGYGGSMKTGFAAATKDLIAVAHADNQFDFREIFKLLSLQQEQNADIVSGIRESGGVDPFHRRLNRWGWNTVVRALFGYLATDIDCGFKLFRRSSVSQLHAPSERGAMIDTQILAGARVRGFKVVEIPVTHLPRTAGKSTGGNPRVIIQSFIDLFKFWWHLKKEIMVERGLAVFPWEVMVLLLVISVAAFSRLSNITGYMTFLGDEGRDVRVMRSIVNLSHLPLIGPGTSVGSMYLGPLYYYLTAPSLLLFNLSPAGPAIFIAGVGLLTIALLWWIGRQWFGRISALLVTALYAISPTVVIYSRSSWNPNIMPFFALLSVYGIWKVWRYGYWRWLSVSAIAFAFVLNSHYLGLILAPFLFLFWLLAIRTQHASRNEAKRSSLYALFFFSLLMSPLLFFDLRHNWQNFEALKLFLSERQTTVNLKAYKALPLLWPLWQQIVTSLLTAKDLIAGQIASLLIPITLLLALARKVNRKDLFFASSWLIAGLIGLGLYKQHIYDHYFGFLFPVLFLLLGFGFRALLHNAFLRPLLGIIFLALLAINIQASPRLQSPNNQLAHTQIITRDIHQLAAGQPFNLALLAKSNYDESYRYFLELDQAPIYTIHQKLTDQLFVVCEVDPCDPFNNPLWEIAAFGWARIDQTWQYPWGVKVLHLVHTTQ